eukprot:COSAG06_NODE_35149_length_463_cov_2.104396_1_plen_101_part_00
MHFPFLLLLSRLILAAKKCSRHTSWAAGTGWLAGHDHGVVNAGGEQRRGDAAALRRERWHAPDLSDRRGCLPGQRLGAATAHCPPDYPPALTASLLADPV